MPKDTRNYTKPSEQFGILLEASSQVYCDFEPKNDFTLEFILEELHKIGLELNPKNKHHYKRICATCDFLMAARYARNGLIIWLSSNDEYVETMYTGKIAREMRDLFIKAGWMREVQKSSKKDKLARIYSVSIPFVINQLKFKTHGKLQSVTVRSEKMRNANGHIMGGKRISPKKFGDEFEKEVTFIRKINSVLSAHPLTTEDGVEFRHGKRIFNNGRLNKGGRMYGPWQQHGEEERLLMTIDGEQVCEIDLKASYLNLSSIIYGNERIRTADPYQIIRFVQSEPDPEQRKKLRALAKKLISAIVGREGATDIQSRTRFPDGEKYFDKITGKKKTISVRKEFNLPENAKAKTYYRDIVEAFPILNKAEGKWADLMFTESQIVLGAVHKLALEGVPAFPVHDSLICKLSDKNRTIGAIHSMMMLYLETTFCMDLSVLDQETEIIEPIDNIAIHRNRSVTTDWGVYEDDISLIEE